MQVIRLLLIHSGLLFLLGGCIFPFDPDIEGIGGALVINGKVTDQEGYHYIEISRSNPVNTQGEIIPVTGYAVEIQDDKGNVFPGSEKEPGLYACWITQEYLNQGTRYRIMVTSDKGKGYTSDFDELLLCPPIENISYEIREMLTPDPQISYQGAQFFVSIDARGDYSQKYLWELEETWEYHSKYEILDYYDGSIVSPVEDSVSFTESSDSLYYCWDTQKIPEIFVFSTGNLTSGKIRNFPLHYVSDQTQRLSVKYSLLLRQHSLSDPAYLYWKTLEIQSKQSGELFETQPSVLTGNIHSLDDPLETVQGLFFAASVKEKRIIVSPNITTVQPNCNPFGLLGEELLEFLSGIHPSFYPIYLARFEDVYILYADQQCFDCRLRGGSTEMPDFWE